ncbi:MAG: hypothetical protein D6722_13485 [Bacteroidetes bacterium]|nr:MAG: hypothetical protein D6722_13485 [Bacteroidota bacterium]
MIKEGDQWKIGRVVLSPMVKTMIYQKTRDFSEWQSILRGFLFQAGSSVLAQESGQTADDSQGAYAILTWSSMDAAKSFFARDGWQDTVETLSSGAVQPPSVLFIENK